MIQNTQKEEQIKLKGKRQSIFATILKKLNQNLIKKSQQKAGFYEVELRIKSPIKEIDWDKIIKQNIIP